MLQVFRRFVCDILEGLDQPFPTTDTRADLLLVFIVIEEVLNRDTVLLADQRDTDD